MKLTLLLITAISLISSAAYAGGNEGGSAGGGNGTHPKMSREPANANEDELEFNQSVDNYAKDCLHKLGSNFKIDTQDKDYRSKIDKEIKSLLDEKVKSKASEISNSELPECYAYARDTKNEAIKAIISPKTNNSFETLERNISSGSAK